MLRFLKSTKALETSCVLLFLFLSGLNSCLGCEIWLKSSELLHSSNSKLGQVLISRLQRLSNLSKAVVAPLRQAPAATAEVLHKRRRHHLNNNIFNPNSIQ